MGETYLEKTVLILPQELSIRRSLEVTVLNYALHSTDGLARAISCDSFMSLVSEMHHSSHIRTQHLCRWIITYSHGIYLMANLTSSSHHLFDIALSAWFPECITLHTFMSLDSIPFAKPVPIESILRLTSQGLQATPAWELPDVVYFKSKCSLLFTPKSLFVLQHVGVEANVFSMFGLGTSKPPTISAQLGIQDDDAAVLRQVVPKT
ncbi:hypothetical protein BDR04DRAFT_186725 [Suillus decipiens]|nr:hypothetical protein BDR04DRAFT_186725 [Suillus decipiens]